MLGAYVTRTPIVSVLDLAYEDDRALAARTLGIERLVSVDRNGKFAHLLQPLLGALAVQAASR